MILPRMKDFRDNFRNGYSSVTSAQSLIEHIRRLLAVLSHGREVVTIFVRFSLCTPITSSFPWPPERRAVHRPVPFPCLYHHFPPRHQTDLLLAVRPSSTVHELHRRFQFR